MDGRADFFHWRRAYQLWVRSVCVSDNRKRNEYNNDYIACFFTNITSKCTGGSFGGPDRQKTSDDGRRWMLRTWTAIYSCVYAMWGNCNLADLHRSYCEFCFFITFRAVIQGNYIGFADKVLVDGPCSGLGVLRRKPEIKLRPVLEEVKELAEKQLAILENACQYVKPGGDLLYSTCTINPLENEKMSAWIVENFPFELEEERQFIPGEDETDGFYYARLRRK